MSEFDHEFSFLCEGSEEAPHPVLTDHRLGFNAIISVPVCPECGEPMKLVQSKFDRRLDAQSISNATIDNANGLTLIDQIRRGR